MVYLLFLIVIQLLYLCRAEIFESINEMSDYNLPLIPNDFIYSQELERMIIPYSGGSENYHLNLHFFNFQNSFFSLKISNNYCTLKYNKAELNTLGYNIFKINYGDPSSVMIGVFVNSNTLTTDISTQCLNEKINIQMFNITLSETEDVQIFEQKEFNNIMDAINAKNYLNKFCNKCDYFQTVVSFYFEDKKLIINWSVNMLNYNSTQTGNTNIANMIYILSIIDPFVTNQAPVKDILIYNNLFENYSYLNQMKEIKRIGNTNILYFLINNYSKKSFDIITINLSNIFNFVYPFTQIPNQANTTNLNIFYDDTVLYDSNNNFVEYDQELNIFLFCYISKFILNPFSNYDKFTLVIYLFSLDSSYKNVAIKYTNNIVISNQGDYSNNNKISYIKWIKPFLIVCDLNGCYNFKIPIDDLSKFEKNTLTMFKNFNYDNLDKNIYQQMNRLSRFGQEDYITYNTKFYFSMFISTINSISYSNQINRIEGNKNCLFYNNIQTNKCSLKCLSSEDLDSINSQCVSSSCSNYINKNNCVNSCSSYFIEISQQKYCIAECPKGYYILGNQCMEKCPIGTYIKNSTNQCVDKSNCSFTYGRFCLEDCLSGYASGSTTPFRCSPLSSCPPINGFAINSKELNMTANVTLCVSCKVYYQNECFDTCPQYTVAEFTQVPGNCINCKTLNKNFFQGKCIDTLPKVPSILINEDFNAYIPCYEANKKIYNLTCVEICPVGYYLKYDNSDNTCLSPTTTNMLIYNNTLVYSCPPLYSSDDKGMCYKCSEKGLIYNNYQCVIKCPTNYYSNNITCKTCEIYDPSFRKNYNNGCNCKYGTLFNDECVICGDLNMYLYNSNCVQSCPLYSAIDYDAYNCTLCKAQEVNKFLYKNKCLEKCPLNTTVTDSVCVEEFASCSGNICNGGACQFSLLTNQYICTCPTGKTGKLCELETAYLDNFYGSIENTVNNNKNGSLINTTPALIKDLYNNISYIENNVINYNNTYTNSAISIIDNVIDSYIQNNSTVPNSNYTGTNIFSLLDLLMNLIVPGINTAKINGSDTSVSLNNFQQTKNDLNTIVGQVINTTLQNSSNINNVSINIIEDNFKVQVYSSFEEIEINQLALSNNMSIIDFKACEDKIRSNYNIPSNTSLLIKKTDLSSKITSNITSGVSNLNSPSVVIKVYNPLTMEEIDFKKICYETQITFKIPTNSDKINITKYAEFLKLYAINIYDPNDPFYNDICFAYNDTQGDMTLSDRRSLINQGVQVQCGDPKCNFTGFDQNYYAICKCFSVSEVQSDLNYGDVFLGTLEQSNFQLFLCYNKVFDGVNYFIYLGNTKIQYWILRKCMCISSSLLFYIYNSMFFSSFFVYNF